LVVVSGHGEDAVDGGRQELDVVRDGEGGVSVVVVGAYLEGESGSFHVVVDVVDDHPEPVAAGCIADVVGIDHAADEARRHVCGVHLVEVENVREVHVAPLVDFLIDLELELQGVVALVLPDPHILEGNRAAPKTGRIGVAAVYHLVVAAKARLHLARRGAPVT
jgi:hypothetical protein